MAPRNRRRKEENLPLLRRGPENRLDVVAKSHVEHPVGLVEHDQLRSLSSFRVPPLHVVHHPAGRADHDLCARSQRAELPLVGLAAVNRHRMDAPLEEGQLGHLLGDLYRELAGRAQDQHLHRPDMGIDPLDRRQGERRRLAGPGRRLAHDVAARQHGRNHGRLDRGCLLEAHLCDGLERFRERPSSAKGRFSMPQPSRVLKNYNGSSQLFNTPPAPAPWIGGKDGRRRLQSRLGAGGQQDNDDDDQNQAKAAAAEVIDVGEFRGEQGVHDFFGLNGREQPLR